MSTPTKKVENLERMTSMVMANWWSLVTTAPWHQVSAPGWLNRFSEHGMRKHDRIEVVANFHSDVPELGTLLVVENSNGHVKTRLLMKVKHLDAQL